MLERALTKCHEFLEVIHHIPEVMQSPVMQEEQREKCNKERSSILWKGEWVQTTRYYLGEKYYVSSRRDIAKKWCCFASATFERNFQFFMEEYIYM